MQFKMHRFVDNKVVVSITGMVKAGQEINNSYGKRYHFPRNILFYNSVIISIFAGPQIGRMKRSDRREILRRKYFFDCNCVACSG